MEKCDGGCVEGSGIFKGNQSLAQAYAVHALDVYDHYRYRAWQAQNKLDGKPLFEGNIDIDDQWLQPYLDGTKGDIARYFAGA